MKIASIGMASVDVTLTSKGCELLKEACLNLVSGDPDYEDHDFALICMAGLFETASDMADLRNDVPVVFGAGYAGAYRRGDRGGGGKQ